MDTSSDHDAEIHGVELKENNAGEHKLLNQMDVDMKSVEMMRDKESKSCQGSARGYHLFQQGPIKLLKGALDGEIPRRPGSSGCGRLVAKSAAPQNDSNSRISMIPSSLLASRVSDYRKWVLAVKTPEGEEEEVGDEEFVLRAKTPAFEGNFSGKGLSNEPPIEDLITPENLKEIMEAFSNTAENYYDLLDDEKDEKKEDGYLSGRRHDKSRVGRVSNVTPQYDRKLTVEEFVSMIKEVIPVASSEVILELANKVDYECSGFISWSDLSTYLVSQTTHHTFLSNAKAEFSQIPEPLNCFMESMHQLVSCYCINTKRKLILTGGQEGSVRAWTLATLSYRGLLFSTDSWITGIHFSESGRHVFVTTMDKEVFILESSSFEVLRVYRGRGVDDSAKSLVYAHDSTRTVTVGGIPVLSRKLLERQLVEAAKLNEKSKPPPPEGAVTSASACEALNFDVLPLTGEGTGPYIERSMEECVLVGLIDPVTCSAYNCSMLDEECIILGTTKGEIYFYILHNRSNQKVILRHHLLNAHSARVNKMVLLYSMNALVSAGDDGIVVVTSMVNGQVIRTFQSNHQHHHTAVRDFAIYSHFRLLVTTGPERFGLVWEFSQELPVAVLEAHNSPCRCCMFSPKNSQVVTVGVDGSIFIFDMSGFHLAQKLEPGFAYSPLLTTCSSSGSLLCFRRYPYHLRMKRLKASGVNEKYKGHTAAVAYILYTEAFRQIVTVDVEFSVMTWSQETGTNLFTFMLNGYSDSATVNSSMLTCAALDAAQRRLITGYQNGVVVVWNVVNGQAINFITAGMKKENQTESRGERSKSATSSIHPRPGSPPSQKKLNKKLKTTASRPVRTVGSLFRDGSTIFLFSIDDYLFVVTESSNYTVAQAFSWQVPMSYGEITAMIQVSPQVMACGTSIGAIFFFHVLSEKQDGGVRWLPDYSQSLVGIVDPVLGATMADERLVQRRQTASANSIIAQQLIHTSTSSNKVEKQGHLVARVTQMFALTGISSNLFLTVHADGTVAFWHAFRRVYLGSINLTAAVVDEGKDLEGNIVVAVDEANKTLVFGDEGGNIHVCEFDTRVLKSEEEEGEALGLGNPLLFFSLLDEGLHRGEVFSSTPRGLDSPKKKVNDDKDVLRHDVGDSCIEGTRPEGEDEGSPASEKPLPHVPHGSHPNRYFQERQIHLLNRFVRVNVFGTGVRSMSSLMIAKSYGGQCLTGHNEEGNTPEGTEDAAKEPVIVCTGPNSLIRCFTLKGTPIGELGMDPWILGDTDSYRYMGEPYLDSTVPATFTLEGGYFFDYLSEYLSSIRQSCSNTTRKGRLPRLHPSLSGIGDAGLAKATGARFATILEETSVRGPGSLAEQGEGDGRQGTSVGSGRSGSITAEEPRARPTTLRELLPVPLRQGRPINCKIYRSIRERRLCNEYCFRGVLKREFLAYNPSLGNVEQEHVEEEPAEEGQEIAKITAHFLNAIESVLVDDKSSSDNVRSSPFLRGDVQRLALSSTPVPHSEPSLLAGDENVSLNVSNKPPCITSLNPSPKKSSQTDLSPSPLGEHSVVDGEEKSAVSCASASVSNNISSTLFSPPRPTPASGANTSVKAQNAVSEEKRSLDFISPPQLPTIKPSLVPVVTSPTKKVMRDLFRQKSPTSDSKLSRPISSSSDRSRHPQYIHHTWQKYKKNGSTEPDIDDPNALLRSHMEEKRIQLVESGCTEASKRRIEQELSKCNSGKRAVDEASGVTQLGPYVDNVLEKHRKKRSPSAVSGTLSFIVDISSRMHTTPLQNIEAPLGSKSRGEVEAWKEHLSRLQKNTHQTSNPKTQ